MPCGAGHHGDAHQTRGRQRGRSVTGSTRGGADILPPISRDRRQARFSGGSVDVCHRGAREETPDGGPSQRGSALKDESAGGSFSHPKNTSPLLPEYNGAQL
ncbi:hypothetical protein SKAU_G00240150 [Synaphobranchus kaupii]|uniref:Uncharacterized protein n=1 Tax=Synaphobranchus kaupii TaxID=118154 RepID=A0A9Q1IU59_SYNKA|nr:hypothetical protein SKAU_G00240150 [Synaphobranchus kaupii]